MTKQLWRVSLVRESLQLPYVQVKLLEAGAPLTGGLQRRVKAVEELGSLTVLCVAGGSHCLRLASLSMALSSIQSGCYYILSTLIHNVTMDMETVSCLLHCGQWVRQTSRVCQAGHCEARAGHLSAVYDPGQGGSEAGDPV